MARLKLGNIKLPNGEKATIRVSEWFPPYFLPKNRDGKTGKKATTLPYITKAKCGVYLIRNKKTKEILYTGFSATNLYRTMYRHFQSWKDKKQYRATYKDHTKYEVMVILNRNCDNAFLIEQYYLQKLNPRDNRRQQIDLFNVKLSGFPKLPTKSSGKDWKSFVPF